MGETAQAACDKGAEGVLDALRRAADLSRDIGRFDHAGGHVGQQRKAQHLQAAVDGGDDLGHGRHADGVAAQDAGGADFGRRFKLRAGKVKVDALAQLDAQDVYKRQVVEKAKAKVAGYLEGKTVVKEIYVPDKLVNLVAK